MRKPQKTPFQLALREAERSVSGALFRAFVVKGAREKALLRNLFSAVLASQLSRSVLNPNKTLSQLSESQRVEFLALEERLQAKGVSNGESVLKESVAWFLERNSVSSAQELETVNSQSFGEVLLWVSMAQVHVERKLRQEPDPEAVDWGRRELEFRTKVAQLGPKVSCRVELASASFQLLGDGAVLAESSLQVLGVYWQDKEQYEAGWGMPDLSQAARPLPVMGCASELFRATLSEARSESRFCAWRSSVDYIFEHETQEGLYFLGLSNLTDTNLVAQFELSDIRDEVLAKLAELQSSLLRHEPERARDLFREHSQTLSRRLTLFSRNSESYRRLEELCDGLKDLSEGIDLRSFFGGKRDSVRSKDERRLKAKLGELQKAWRD